MERGASALVAEIESAVSALGDPGHLDDRVRLATFRDRLAEWRQATSAFAEGTIRDRAIWALMGAERYVSDSRELTPRGVDPAAARLRLQAASRALRALLAEDAPPIALPPLA